MDRKRKTQITAFLSGIKGGKNNITKTDIVDFVAAETGHTKKDVKIIIDSTLNAIKDLTESGGYITFKGFGVFYQTKRKGYTMETTDKQRRKFKGKLPKVVKVPARKVLVFKASKND